MEDFFTKPEELLEKEFEANKKFNKSQSPEHKLPENLVEYVERLIIENIRNQKNVEKENIPQDLKAHRLEYLQNQQEALLNKLSRLKKEEEN